MKTNKIVKFLFPFWPWKIFRSIIGICILASLVALSIILNFFKIKITAGITISVAWMPSMIIAWFFGPVIGFTLGFVIDTINWLINPGYWFWLYAIQEPMLGLIVGLLSSIFNLIKERKNHFTITVITNQFLLIGFLVVSIFVAFFYTDPNNFYFNQINTSRPDSEAAGITKITQTVLRWVILAIMIFMFFLIEGIILYKYLRWKNNKDYNTDTFEIFLFMTVISIISSVIFSFLLGPISAIEYYKALNNTDRVPSLVKFGVIYYVFPRIIKEAFKTPLYIAVLSLVVCALNPTIKRVKNHFYISYHQI